MSSGSPGLHSFLPHPVYHVFQFPGRSSANPWGSGSQDQSARDKQCSEQGFFRSRDSASVTYGKSVPAGVRGKEWKFFSEKIKHSTIIALKGRATQDLKKAVLPRPWQSERMDCFGDFRYGSLVVSAHILNVQENYLHPPADFSALLFFGDIYN